MSEWTTPMGDVTDAPAHHCGKCSNPFLGGRADCPNNRLVMTDEQIANMLDEWSLEP